MNLGLLVLFLINKQRQFICDKFSSEKVCSSLQDAVLTKAVNGGGYAATFSLTMFLWHLLKVQIIPTVCLLTFYMVWFFCCPLGPSVFPTNFGTQVVLG